METHAELSPCRQYRYSLTRRWASGPQVLFVMLNPSTADETDDDPTIGKCIKFAKSWGYGGLVVGNLFAYRTPSPELLMTATDPIGPDNDEWLVKLQKSADLTIAAWGNSGSFMERSKAVTGLLSALHILHLNKTGEPKHPLYVAADTKPVPWELSAR